MPPPGGQRKMITEQLLEKSKEAFIMAIEIYNKPTLHYRLEGFSFFICNAWELMLKAHITKKEGAEKIYYPDKPNRTISLENCIQRIFTNAKDPLRRNLEKIVELRNTSTHFITEEYEAVYIPLLQSCVFNFVDKMMEFHGIDMTRLIPENFLTLSVRITSLDETEIRAKYDSQVAEKIISSSKAIGASIGDNNHRYAIRVEHLHYATKDRNEATEFYHIEKEAKVGVRVIKELKNPNDTHKYNAKACITEINKRIARDGVPLMFRNAQAKMNQYHFQNFVNYFGIKENEKLCFIYQVSQSPQYSYSQQAIDFIYGEIKKSPQTILDDLKEKNKKVNPRSKGF